MGMDFVAIYDTFSKSSKYDPLIDALVAHRLSKVEDINGVETDVGISASCIKAPIWNNHRAPKEQGWPNVVPRPPLPCYDAEFIIPEGFQFVFGDDCVLLYHASRW
ncbi:MAG: hypothetical protein JWN70_596, partial [Planctomycetaceae bacterium]|nr:hypothetical protein [Planctomycetaceae bacterium]